MITIPPIHEHTFSVDDFNEPKKFENARAVMALLTRMLLLDPGTIQSHPDAGIGLVSRYRYTQEGSEYQLKSDITTNIEKYLPEFQGAEINVSRNDHNFYIGIQISSYLFSFVYDVDEASLNGHYKTIQDL